MKTYIFLLLILSLAAAGVTYAQDTKPVAHPTMAPVGQYRIANRDEEIALARTAAPPSISADADVLVLGSHGYETAVKGKNGFVCFVELSWAADFNDPEFWDPTIRAPNCFNAPAARSELPQYLKRTEWALSGDTKQQMIEKTRSAFAGHTFKSPEPGALSFMLSKSGYLGDQAGGPWLPHVMLFVPKGQDATWGANLQASPIISQEGSAIESSVIMIPVRRWSDGSPAPPPAPLKTALK